MGGCRCTYRNCTVRTDGTTHMFHYPVFDKVRCHQWLTNAQKLEFLNLKVSQLKNRVICQHHFKFECFMNFKKDKLTFEAVPTLDGPFCDPGQYANNTISQDETKIYPISLDDIENEYLTLYDKKANFSVKYGDFLTNCELMDVSSFDPVNKSKTHVIYKDKQKRVKNVEESHVINLNDNVDKLPDSTTLNVLPNKTSTIPEDTQTQLEDLVLAGYTLVQPNVVDVEYEGLQSNQINHCEKSSKNDHNDKAQQTNQKDNKFSDQVKKDTLQNSRVKILSEKKVSEPVSLSGKLKPVSPSLILCLPEKRLKKKGPENVANSKTKDEIKAAYMNILNNSTENMLSRKGVPISNKNEKAGNKAGCMNILNTNIENVSSSKEVPVIEIMKKGENKAEYINIINNNTDNVSSSKEVTITLTEKQLNMNCGQRNQKFIKNKVSNGIFPKKSLLKPKINQVRVAAIKEKRKFNMKLRDIIESCLDKMDDQGRGQTENNTNPKNENVGTFLSKDFALPSEQQYTIACLDARMKRMEEILSNKIDQNTQRIIELKNSVLTSTKKSAFTQTTNNEESHKKNLYKEISKYLSANVNSLIYEELFINKYAQSSSQDTSSPKRRKRR